MKDYKRLTNDWFDCNRCPNGECENPGTFCVFRGRCEEYNRLKSLEDKIERGELVDINELMEAETTRDLTEKEIEFFIKHNEKVRKETAREILRMIKDKGLFRYGGYLLHDSDFDTVGKLYGLELENEE